MEITLDSIIGILGLLFGGGAIGGIFTWRWQRAKAKAEAKEKEAEAKSAVVEMAQKVQDTYQEMLEDKNKEVEDNHRLIAELREDRDHYKKGYVEMRDEVEKLSKDFSDFKFESYAHKKMQMTENGVVSLFVTKSMKKKFKLSNEDASASVFYMDGIKDSLIWIAFIQTDDGAIRVRLRSRYVTVSELAEKYNGGGHACAAGATVYSKKEMKQLLADADALLKEYKENNTGWL